MAIVERTRLYEALVRWNPDGSVAAHQATITELVDDTTGDVKSASVNLPIALQAADVASVVGETVPGWQAQADTLTAQVADLGGQLEAANADKQAALDGKAASDAALADMTAQRDTLQAQLDAIQNPPILHVISQRFKIAMDQLVPGLLKTVDDWVATQPVATQLRWNYPEFYRNDEMLTETAGLIVGMVPNLPTNDPAALLDQIFALAKTLP